MQKQMLISQLKQLTLATFKILSEWSCKYTSSKIADFNYMMKHKGCTIQNEMVPSSIFLISQVEASIRPRHLTPTQYKVHDLIKVWNNE